MVASASKHSSVSWLPAMLSSEIVLSIANDPGRLVSLLASRLTHESLGRYSNFVSSST